MAENNCPALKKPTARTPVNGFIIALVSLLLAASPVGAVPGAVRHSLTIKLFPETHRLVGQDTLDITRPDRGVLNLRLAERAEILSISGPGAPLPYTFENGLIQIPIEPETARQSVRVTITYSAVFDDPVPVRPVNTDNPGFGVEGSISDRGVLLLSGSSWYPVLSARKTAFTLWVDAPEPTVSVTSGRFLGHRTEKGRTLSGWEATDISEALTLTAGAYRVRTKQSGDLSAMTFFLSDDTALSEAYLDATLRYLQMYRTLFGPYPFAKFAVVENFFPTGYGFPGYTLLGSRVLRLPFIISTSLGHEIAHCWWGNGVQVDLTEGNWCEGLVTYVADYHFKELAGASRDKKYRIEMMRNFSTLVPPSKDVALSRFTHRHDAASKAIGYDKGAFVFHMLRQTVGDNRFWHTLGDIFERYRFKPLAWSGLKAAFEHRSGRSLDAFFDQWVYRKGAPFLSLNDIAVQNTGNHWLVTGTIFQQAPFYTLNIQLQLKTAGTVINQVVPLSGKSAAFQFRSTEKPTLLTADPEHHLLRRLSAVEIPPTINRLRGHAAADVVLPGNTPPGCRGAVDLLLKGLGIKQTRRLADTDRLSEFSPGNHLILIGDPRSFGLKSLIPALTPTATREENANSKLFDNTSDAWFAVIHHPHQSGYVAAIFQPGQCRSAEEAARKIPHYGKYSYLAFRSGENTLKGTWPVRQSPLQITLDTPPPKNRETEP